VCMWMCRPTIKHVAWIVPASMLVAAFVYAGQFQWKTPAPTRQILDCRGRVVCEVCPGGVDAEKGYWPVPVIPYRIRETLLSVEDRRFDRHPGVDPLAVFRAFVQNFRSGRRISGASTIAMQVARLRRPGSRTYANKLREMVDAVVMTVRFGRRRVLDQYLRLAPYGNGIRGIGYAAQAYFNKPLQDLSWAEIAFLSAIPQQPVRMNPRTADGRTRVVRRARYTLKCVYRRGFMTRAEYERARVQVTRLELTPRFRQPEHTIHLKVYFNELLRCAPPAETASDCRIQSFIDMNLQWEVTELARACVDAWSASGAQNAAVMVIDTADHSVIASVGSVDYFDAEGHGAIDYTRVKRSPGSTLKPFIYALALDSGMIHADSKVIDGRSIAGEFRNFDGVWLGDIPVDQALASSRNVPAVHLLRRIGVHRAYGCFADLRLHGYRRPSSRYGLGLAVGGLPVTVMELARAYTVFTGQGRLHDLQFLNGSKRRRSRRIISPGTARAINQILSDPMARLPSFPRMGHLEYAYPVAVKTGTSEGCRDAWTVAWSRKYRVVTWLGRPDGRPMRNVGGYRAAAELARRVMDQLHPDYNLNPPGGFYAAQSTDVHSPASSRSMKIISPEHRSLYYFDPEVPGHSATIALTADVPDNVSRITWIIDGIPFKTVRSGTPAFWPMSPGDHVIHVMSKERYGDTVDIRVQ